MSRVPDPDAGIALRPLRGRESESAVIAGHLSALQAGTGGFLLISGRPGAGKTRLLEELELRCAEAGVRYLSGGGDPDGRMTPFSPILSAISSIDSDAGLDGDRPPSDDVFWILQDVQDRLERAVSDESLVIAIDDVQWCDDGSVLALKTLPLRLRSLPILWVLAVRDDAAASAGMEDLFARYRDVDSTRIDLSPLSELAVAAMVDDAGQTGLPESMQIFVARAAGIPLYVVEALDALGAQVEDIEDATLGFEASALHRASTLSSEAFRAIQVASLIARIIRLPVLNAVIESTSADLTTLLDEAVRARILVAKGNEYRFIHDRVREVIAAGVTTGERRSLQRRAITAQLAQGGSVVEIADMLAGSAVEGDIEAVSLLRQAAHRLASVSPATAVRLSSRALELSGLDYPDRAQLASETVVLLWQDGQAAASREVGELELSRVRSPEQEAQLRLGLARLLSQFSFSEAVRHATTALGIQGLTRPLRSKLRSLLELNLSMTGDFRDMAAITDETEDQPTLVDDATEATVVATRSVVEFYEQRWLAAFASMHQAMILADRAGTRYSTFAVEACWASFIRAAAGDISGALRETDRGVAETQRLRQGAALRFWVMTRARALLDAGRFPDAAAEAQAVLDMVDELGPGNFADATATYTLARIALFTGDQSGVDRFAPAVNRMLNDEAALVRSTGGWIAALVHDSRGESELAFRALEPSLQHLGERGPYLGSPMDPADDVMLVRIALRAGRMDTAEKVVEFSERRSRLNPSFAILKATSLHARALLSDDLSPLHTAIVLLEPSQRPTVLASALEDFGRITARTDPHAAASSFARAFELYRAGGASGEADRVRSRITRSGADADLAVDDEKPGWDGLTRSQQAVAALIASGLTNRQVAQQLHLSPHTVGTHLRIAYLHLGVHSRVELAAIYFDWDREPRRA